MTTDCVFCEILAGRQDIGSPVPYNTILASNSSFILIPAVGPLTPGHVLVVSRRHLPGLAFEAADIRRAYEGLLDETRVRTGSVDILEAEHGGTHNHSGGSCISHTHVNLIPGFGKYVDMFEETLPPLLDASTLDELTGTDKPYIFLRSGEKTRIHGAEGVPSQLIRIRLCELLGRDDWDWASSPAYDVVRSTLELWGRQK